MIKITNLQKSYGQFKLKINDLNIRKGDRVALVGNNGAGKTTLLKLILDLIKTDSGQIFINNNKYDVSSDANWKRHVNSYLDEEFLISFLSPREYIDFILKVYKSSILNINKDLYNKILSFFDFNQKSNKLIRDLSKGNKLKIGIISAIITTPQLLLLDEPFSNLDPTSKYILLEILQANQEFCDFTTLISSHDINEVIKICNKVLLIEDGKVILFEEINNETISYLNNYFRVYPKK